MFLYVYLVIETMEHPFVLYGSMLILPLVFLAFRITFIIYKTLSTDCKLEKNISSLKTILCVGSGGHTSELLRLIKHMDLNKYQPRMYILADNDVSSEVKIQKLEKELDVLKYTLYRIPRSRNVNQSYISSVSSTVNAILHTFPVVYNFKPDIILCNGPGTCIPVCIISFLFRCVYLLDCRIIFVESICRVRTLSLTGKILQYFADIIVVQWPQLREVCYRAKYFGRLT